MLKRFFISLALTMILAQSLAAAIHCEIINYDTNPVFASAVNVDAAEVYSLLGIEYGSAVVAIIESTNEQLPTAFAKFNGEDVIKVYVSLEGSQRIGIEFLPASEFSQISFADWDEDANEGFISNSLVNINLTQSGLRMEYAGGIGSLEDRYILRNIHFKGWLDDVDSGSVIDPVSLGLSLVDTRTAPIVDAQATIAAGNPQLILTRIFEGKGENVLLTETITALPYLAGFKYVLEFTNQGQADAYIAWADGQIKGTYEKYQSWVKTPYWGTSLFDLSQGSFSDHVKYWYNPPSWSYLASTDSNNYGIGLTTLKLLSGSHYHNKTQWSVSERSFALDQVETVSGYLPITIAPQATAQLGGCIIAANSGTNAFRQTQKFFATLNNSLDPILETPYAVALSGDFIKGAKNEFFQEDFSDYNKWIINGCNPLIIDDKLELTMQSDYAEVKCGLEMGFSDEKILHAFLSEIPKDLSFQVFVRRLNSQDQPILICSNDAVGEVLYDIHLQQNINALTGWNNFCEFELIIAFDGKVGDEIIISNIDIIPPASPAPETVSPLAGWDVTDFAVCFSWKKVDQLNDYQVMLSTDPDFASSITYDIVSTDELCTYHTTELLNDGDWYWRVRAVDSGLPGDFSEPIAFSVNNNHLKTTPQRLINAENPLFTLEASKVPDLSAFAQSIPEDIRPHTAIVSGTDYFVYKKTPLEHYAPIHYQTNNHLLRTHGPGKMGWAMSLTDVEWLFKNYENVLGICVGENFWNYWQWESDGTKEYISRLIKLCAKYGKVYIWGDGNGTTFKWQQFASNDYWINLTAEYGEYLVFGQKNNVNHTMHTTQGALLGMWLSSMMSNIGSWSECWYWNDAGFAGIDEYLGPKMGYIDMFPRNFYNMSFMHGIAQGAAVFNVDGQGTTGNIKASIWDKDGNTTETFNNFVVPFIRGVVNHKLVPQKSDVLKKVKIAVSQPMRFENIAHQGQYGIYQALYEQTYGFREDGIWYEYFPNTGKYYYIPLLPYGINSIGEDVNIQNINDLSEPSYVKNIFDAQYTDAYNGSALHSVVGDSLFIQSTHENSSNVEDYEIAVETGNITQISGDIGPHKYIIGKFDNKTAQFWLQTNTEYWQHSTQIVFDCKWQPMITAQPQESIMLQSWDPQLGTYTVWLTNLFGAAELTLDSADLNGDKNIDFLDIYCIADFWLSSSSNLAGDFNSDGIINYIDLAVIFNRLKK